MVDHVISFSLQVTTLSPLHIGNGEALDQKWFLWNGQQATLLDPDKLVAQVVARQQVSSFEQFCLDPQANASDFLVATRIPIPEVAAYSLSCPVRPREILTFIKTGGLPYLPGSSLKGAVRSNLLRAFFIQNEVEVLTEATERLRQSIQRRDKLPGQVLEQLLFTGSEIPKDASGRPHVGKASNFDLLRTFSLSDSGRLKANCLQILPVQVLSAQANGTLAPKNFKLYPELLTPGWRFKMRMSLDLSPLREQYGPDRLGLQDRRHWILEFAKYCRIAATNILEQESKFYHQYRRPRLAEWCEQRLAEIQKFGPNECVLPLGWGTGYDTKTVTDLFDPDLFEDVLESYPNTRRLGRSRGRGDWLGPDLSPKTRRVTTWKDEEVPLGWVKLSA